jgi:putative membrane protein
MNENRGQGYYDNNGNWVTPRKVWWKELIPYAITNSLSLTIACSLLDGITFESFGSVVFAAVLLTLINWGLKPFVHIISLPISVLTFGIFALLINGLFLGLVAFLIPGFNIASLGTAIFGSIIITVCNLIIRAFLPD